MHLRVDFQSAVIQQAGVGRYTREVSTHLAAALSPPDRLTLNFFDFRRQALPPDPIPGAQMEPIRWIPGRLAQALWKRIHAPAYDRLTGDADVFLFPNFVIPPLRRGRAVVTIHDLAFMRYPQFAEQRNVQYLNAHLEDTVARADAIITVSKFSAREIENHLNVPKERVFPVYHGIDPRFRRPDPGEIARIRKSLGLDRPYWLTVGTVEPRKNLPHLVSVFEQMTDFDGDLVIAGGMGWNTGPIRARIRQSPRADAIRCIGYVGDDILPALYAGAEVFLLASFYEGFGFPPVEAMACGTPVVSSTGGSLEEILGQGAVLLNTFDPDGWTDAIRKVLHDTEFREALVDRGRRHAAGYTWPDCAQKTWDVVRRVLT